MKKTKIVSVIICILLCISLASCTTMQIDVPQGLAEVFVRNFMGGDVKQPANNNANTSSEAPSSEAEQPASNAPSEAPASSEAPSEAPVSSEAPASSEAPVSNEPSSSAPAVSGAPTGKEEIINYYVTAYNKIATDAKKVTRTYDYTSNYNSILDINNKKNLASLAAMLMNKFMVENKEAVDMTAKDLPPVGITKLSISSDKISSAECNDKGSTYEIILKSTGTDDNWEIDSQPGVGSAGCIGPLLRTEDVTGAAGSFIKFEGLHSWYGAAVVKATVDKATGHITAFHFDTPSVLHFDKVTAVVPVKNCNIGLLFTQDWTISY